MTEPLGQRLGKEARLWFPGLTVELVRGFISRSQVEPVLVEEYGTARWLAGSSAPSAPNGGDVRIGSHVAKIEYLSSELAARFEGLDFVDSRAPQICGCVQGAANVLAHIPTIAETVGSVVKSIHPIQALQDHDVSHSTPELPFSIFVSVPEEGEEDVSLRVAESLIHEAMHLQLTLVDSIEPLAVDDHASDYSPWKNETRPVMGLLHGLYVFAVVHEALGILGGVNDEWGQYCRKRRSVIESEVTLLSKAPGGLSRTGLFLWHQCLDKIVA